MPVLKHSPGVLAFSYAGGLRYRPLCGCGWESKSKAFNLPTSQEQAMRQARQHAELKGCGKRRFTEAEAREVLFKAKIQRGIDGNLRRREDRVYQCPECPDESWHLTSKPATSRRTA